MIQIIKQDGSRIDAQVVTDKLTMFGARQFKEALHTALGDSPASLSLDLVNVEQVDTSGVGVLVQLRKELRERGGDLVLHNLKPGVRQVIRVLQLEAALGVQQ